MAELYAEIAARSQAVAPRTRVRVIEADRAGELEHWTNEALAEIEGAGGYVVSVGEPRWCYAGQGYAGEHRTGWYVLGIVYREAAT